MYIYIYIYIHMLVYLCFIYLHVHIRVYMYMYIYIFYHVHREMKVTQRGVSCPQFWRFLCRRGFLKGLQVGWFQILPWTKLIHLGFEQSCSAMAQKLEPARKRYSNTTRMRMQPEIEDEAKMAAAALAGQGHMVEQMNTLSSPALICDSCARRILRAATIWRGYFASFF